MEFVLGLFELFENERNMIFSRKALGKLLSLLNHFHMTLGITSASYNL